ncbi:hypothetical protein [Anaerocolumna sp. MB42-C2]|uniref:hypothetical protein n=1 Tax=Anaerocolumna sp. MB42-C2 TaxID=3070997 RepID=UPI0027DFEAA9|nr:hypothetical protein [Anaerocolumna sp. MB42-C2]WMJ87200.1 hypothetical protein RBU59_24680 [Anaerocolumna sp. MB42-C2]
MKRSKLEMKNLRKTILTSAVVLVTGTLLFEGFTQAAVAAEFKKTEKVPTSYTEYTKDSVKSTDKKVPEGYVKANYTIGTIDLECYKNNKPDSKDITKEAAAEIGAQALWKIFGVNLEGQEIKMGYDLPTETFSRTGWSAEVWIDGKQSYYFSVDSVTGELFQIGYDRTLKEDVSVAYDAALAKNPQEYIELAKKAAAEFNVVHGSIKSVEYNGQGYGNNDPSISIDVKGANGEIALLCFSRYDKKLLSIGYSAQYKEVLDAAVRAEKELKDKTKNKEKTNFSDSTPNFITIE